MLELEDVGRSFPDGTGLRPTSIAINRGEFVAVLGPSGCGKSTLLRCVAGLETPDTGVMRLAGEEVFNDGRRSAAVSVPPAKRNLSMVFQDLALWPHMTVAGNVEFPLTTRGARLSATERRKLVAEALDMVGISAKAGQRPNQLSGGQQQRVAIARAVVSRPDLLLMDEPLSALDAALKVQIRREIVDLTHELGLTVVYVTHDQEEALSMADRVLVLNDGAVAQFDTPVAVYEHPADDFVADFIGTMDRLDDGSAVRPEQVRLAELDDPEGAGTPAIVESCRYLGGRYELRCTVAGASRPWIVHDVNDHPSGARIQLIVPSLAAALPR